LAGGVPAYKQQAVSYPGSFVGLAPRRVSGSLPAHETLALRPGHALDFLGLPQLLMRRSQFGPRPRVRPFNLTAHFWFSNAHGPQRLRLRSTPWGPPLPGILIFGQLSEVFPDQAKWDNIFSNAARLRVTTFMAQRGGRHRPL